MLVFTKLYIYTFKCPIIKINALVFLTSWKWTTYIQYWFWINPNLSKQMTYDNQITFTKKTFSLYKKWLHKFYINFPFTQYPIPSDNHPLIYNQIYLSGTKSNYIITTLLLPGSKFKPFSKCPFVRVFLSELKNQIYWSPFIGCSHTISTFTVS